MAAPPVLYVRAPMRLDRRRVHLYTESGTRRSGGWKGADGVKRGNAFLIGLVVFTLALAGVGIGLFVRQNAPRAQEPIVGYYAVRENLSVNVRAGLGDKYDTLATLSGGTEVAVYEFLRGWARIDYQGRNGYIGQRFLNKLDKWESAGEGAGYCPYCQKWVDDLSNHGLAGCGVTGHCKAVGVHERVCAVLGHCKSDGLTHADPPCGNQAHCVSDWRKHELLICGLHYECSLGDASAQPHTVVCEKCGKFLCDGDHSLCGAASTQTEIQTESDNQTEVENG